MYKEVFVSGDALQLTLASGGVMCYSLGVGVTKRR